jgi:hypothetical protein
MRPVEEISQEMAEISSENLKRRVKTPQTNDEIEELAHHLMVCWIGRGCICSGASVYGDVAAN